jgi:hypothetical protein
MLRFTLVRGAGWACDDACAAPCTEGAIPTHEGSDPFLSPGWEYVSIPPSGQSASTLTSISKLAAQPRTLGSWVLVDRRHYPSPLPADCLTRGARSSQRAWGSHRLPTSLSVLAYAPRDNPQPPDAVPKRGMHRVPSAPSPSGLVVLMLHCHGEHGEGIVRMEWGITARPVACFLPHLLPGPGSAILDPGSSGIPNTSQCLQPPWNVIFISHIPEGAWPASSAISKSTSGHSMADLSSASTLHLDVYTLSSLATGETALQKPVCSMALTDSSPVMGICATSVCLHAPARNQPPWACSYLVFHASGSVYLLAPPARPNASSRSPGTWSAPVLLGTLGTCITQVKRPCALGIAYPRSWMHVQVGLVDSTSVLLEVSETTPHDHDSHAEDDEVIVLDDDDDGKCDVNKPALTLRILDRDAVHYPVERAVMGGCADPLRPSPLFHQVTTVPFHLSTPASALSIPAVPPVSLVQLESGILMNVVMHAPLPGAAFALPGPHDPVAVAAAAAFHPAQTVALLFSPSERTPSSGQLGGLAVSSSLQILHVWHLGNVVAVQYVCL